MQVQANSLAELTSYLHDLRSLVESSSLDRVIYKEGTTLGQIAFHMTESINYYFRVHVLNQVYKRNRDEEFTATHSLQEILSSINKAHIVCDDVVGAKVDFEAKLLKKKEISSRGFTINNVFETVQHVTTHTAEHYGHMIVSA